MNEIQSFPEKRVLLLKMWGTVTRDELLALMPRMGAACAKFGGSPFAMIADMRDLHPLAPDVAELLGQGIAMSRKSGVAVCAHLSSSGIIRLQANRVSREVTAGDASVIDVVSIAEAWRVIAERAEISSGLT